METLKRKNKVFAFPNINNILKYRKHENTIRKVSYVWPKLVELTLISLLKRERLIGSKTIDDDILTDY
jgi:hypothetical protein